MYEMHQMNEMYDMNEMCNTYEAGFLVPSNPWDVSKYVNKNLLS